ncbi:MAG: helix-turn-helix domain-containing protein [Proteobacteria bacterium]|nr:helix-turn-helix domain-containing protein [Pseudomonadota bacterium]
MNRELKALLIKNGIKQKTIAEQAGVSRSTVSGVLGGHAQSKTVKGTTARLLNISIDRLERLWARKAA